MAPAQGMYVRAAAAREARSAPSALVRVALTATPPPPAPNARRPRASALLRAQNERETKRRADELKKEDLRSYVNELNILKGNLQYGERSVEVRRELERRERERELALLAQLDRAEKERALVEAEHHEDQRISEEIERTKRDEERQERQRQRVREESEELRNLREKLRAAEMNFQRSLQLEEKAILETRQREYDVAQQRMMEEKLEVQLQAEAKVEHKRRENLLLNR